MNIQSFHRNSTPKLGLPVNSNEAPQPNSPKPSQKDAGGSSDTFEMVGCAVATGLFCGLVGNTMGSGLGALVSVPVSGLGMATYAYGTANRDGYEGLAGVAGGVAGLVMGGVGAAGAALGSLAGHPVLGGVVAGALFGAGTALMEKR